MRLAPSLTVLAFGMVLSVAAQESNVDYVSRKPSADKNPRPSPHWTIDPHASSTQETPRDQRLIVKLKGDPLTHGRTSQAREIASLHEQFIRDVENLSTSSGQGRTVNPARILFDYRKAFNGFAIIASSEIKEGIQQLPYVVSVTEDKKVEVVDLQSNKIINADKVWSELHITGKGIRIGIIDTGIDYTHPDLGGGFGRAFKVKGGYDFVNDDPDPIDDHGHGTHVAGIAAANGINLKGVAPDAYLYAFKVLSAAGWGFDSWILAGIERTVDPDQNPATNDALDVVNMSLGRTPDATEPLSEAVNNAVAQGVTFVISAGNNYGYFTIGTPGIAAHAITVGATNTYDYTADFSSKGPTENTLQLKPDIAAPGVGIYSDAPNQQYQTMSGTSMSSPHVTGAVALLLQKHPTWTPAIIKGALMNTARNDHGISPWEQGAGRIDVLKAIKTELIMTPGSFSLGSLDRSSPVTIKEFTATLYNVSSAPKNVSLYTKGGIVAPGISITLSASSFTMPANSTRNVNVTVTIQNTLATKIFPDAYTGYLAATDGTNVITSSLALINTHVTKLRFEGELPEQVLAIGIEGTLYFKSFTPSTNEFDLMLPYGKYDIISTFPFSHLVISEGVIVADGQNTVLQLSAAMAKNQIVFKPLDKNGAVIPITWQSQGAAVLWGKDRNFTNTWIGLVDTFYISDQSVYRLDVKLNSKSSDDADIYYDVAISTANGIYASGTYSNDPAAFSELIIDNPSIPAGYNQNIIYYNTTPIFTFGYDRQTVVPNPFRLLHSRYDPESLLTGEFARLSPERESSGYTWQTGQWRVLNNGTINFSKGYDPPIVLNTTRFDYTLGETLIRYNGQTLNQGNKIQLYDYPVTGLFDRYYGDREKGPVYYELKTNGASIKSGVLINKTYEGPGNTPTVIAEAAALQPHTLLLHYNDFKVYEEYGKANVTLEFNLANADSNPPSIRSLSLEVDGESTTNFKSDQAAMLKVSVNDHCTDHFFGTGCTSGYTKSLVARIKKEGQTQWTTLNIQGSNYTDFTASLPENLEEGYYSLLIIATDNVNNSITYDVSPAFYVGDNPGDPSYAVVNLIEPMNDYTIPWNPVFRWSSIDAAQEYHIQLSKTVDFSTLVADEHLTTNTYTPLTALEINQQYYWRVTATVDHKIIPWSSVYTFYMGSLQATRLIEPMDHSVNQPLTIRFKWAPVSFAEYYSLEISLLEDFSSGNYDAPYGGTETTVTNLFLPDMQYYWRVSTIFSQNNIPFIIQSPSFTFNTNTITGTEDPTDFSRSIYNVPNPFATETNVMFTLKKPGAVSLHILDAMGKEVKKVRKVFTSTGTSAISWNGTDDEGGPLPQGMYIGHLQTETEAGHVKMVLHR